MDSKQQQEIQLLLNSKRTMNNTAMANLQKTKFSQAALLLRLEIKETEKLIEKLKELL